MIVLIERTINCFKFKTQSNKPYQLFMAISFTLRIFIRRLLSGSRQNKRFFKFMSFVFQRNTHTFIAQDGFQSLQFDKLWLRTRRNNYNGWSEITKEL